MFDGGLAPRHFYTGSGTFFNKYQEVDQYTGGMLNPIFEDAYGFIVPGNSTFTSVSGEGALSTDRILSIISVDDNNSNVDTTNGTSFYFAQGNKFFALDPTTDTIESTGGFPITLTHGAHTNLVVDRIVQFGDDTGIPTVHVFGRDATDAFAGVFDKTNGYSEDGVAGDTTNWNNCGLNNLHKIVVAPADNTFLYFAQDNKVHQFSGTVGANTVRPNVLVLSKTSRIADMHDAFGKMWILVKPYSQKTDTTSGLNTFSTSRKCLVLVWNRISTQVAIDDSIALDDCNDVSYLYPHEGTIYAFVNGSNKINQLRVFDGKKFVLAAEIGRNEDGVPACKDSIIDYMGGILWQDTAAVLWWYGQPVGSSKKRLYKIGRSSTATAGTGGAIISKSTSTIYTTKTVSGSVKIEKWNSQDGSATSGGITISIGNINIPKLSTINGITLFFLQSIDNTDTGTSALYINTNNYSNTISATVTIDHNVDIPRGYLYAPLNINNVNVLGLSFEYSSSARIIDLPLIYKIEIDYTPTTKLK